MSRLKELRNYINKELYKIEDLDECSAAFIHLYGVSLASTMIAKKRGLDPELLSMAAMLHDLHAYISGSYEDHAHKGAELAAMLHDLHAYISGSYEDHAHKGAELAREILNSLKLTTDDETEMICSAVYHHDDKLVEDGPIEEALKDADVISHCLHDTSKAVKEKEQKRYEKLCDEFWMM